MDTAIISVNKPSSVVVKTYNVCHSSKLPSEFLNKNHNKDYNTKINGVMAKIILLIFYTYIVHVWFAGIVLVRTSPLMR